MPAHLVIHDGSPWWASPDIWVVPGSDPNGPPGSPIAGRSNYMWARVTNSGNVSVSGCRVDFYWANPSAAIVVGVATLIGSAFVDLAPLDTQEVLCLVPWVPVIVNGGHECVLAVAHGVGDQNPIPDPLPNGFVFDPPAHDQVAQLNLSVLEASALSLPLTLFVAAIGRSARRSHLTVEMGQGADERLLANFGLKGLRPASTRSVEVALGREPRCDAPEATRELVVEVPRGTSVPVFVHLRARELERDEYQLVHVVERDDKRVLGGVSYLVVNTRGNEPRIAGKERGS